MASLTSKTKKPRTKAPKSRPATTSALSQLAAEDSSSSSQLSLFSPLGELFAFLSLALDKHRLRVYDTVTGNSIAQFVVESARVSSLCWAHFDLEPHLDDGPKRKRKRKNPQGELASASLPSPGIILGLTNGSLILFSPTHGKVVKSISHPSSTGALVSVVVDGNGVSEIARVWTSGADGVIRLWDLHESRQVDHWKTDERIPYTCLAVRPTISDDGEATEILAANYAIQLLSVESTPEPTSSNAKTLQKQSSFNGHASSVKCLRWDTHSRFLSSAEADRFVYLWDVPEVNGREGKVAASIPLDAEVRATAFPPQPETSSSSKSQTLLTLSASGRVSIFPLESNFSAFANSKSKIPTLVPKSSIIPPSSKKGADVSRTQVIAATFVHGEDGKIRIARLIGGVKPNFEAVVSDAIVGAVFLAHSEFVGVSR